MTDVRDAVASFRDDRPGADDALREVLAVDADADTWEFDDVDVTTGVFGELVSRDIVERHDDGYRLADRAAVAAAVSDGTTTTEVRTDTDATASPALRDRISLPTASRRRLAGLVLALCLVVAFRVTSLPAVYQNGHVVLLANDPYFYRHWVFEFLAAGRSPLAVSGGIEVGEPLLVATLQTATTLLGGTPRVADQVLAWYPVVAAVGSALAVYWLARQLTDDHRVAIASVVLLAVLPVHGYRTALGFADHHAFDYLILGLTFAAVVTFERAGVTSMRELASRYIWPWVGLAGVGIAAHVLAWNAGALLLVPLAAFAVVRALVIVRHDEPAAAMGPLLCSTALGGVLAYAGHAGFGWQSFHMIAPAVLLAGGVVVVTIVAGLARWQDVGLTPAVVGIVGSGAVLLVAAVVLLPEFGAELSQEVSRQFLGGERDIAETRSLFDTDLGFIVAPFGYFGLSIFFALPVFAWAGWFGWAKNRGEWLAFGAYAWVLFVISISQVRFAGHLALPTAVGAGLAFVWLAAKVGEFAVPGTGRHGDASDARQSWRGLDGTDGTRATDRDLRSTASVVVGLFLLIGGLGTVMTPIGTAALTPDSDTVTAAVEMDTHAAEHDLTGQDQYVFSEWSWNRMYNAMVSNQSRSYGYARANFGDFLSSTDNAAWYDRLQNRAGFVVVTELDDFDDAPDATMYGQLQRGWGIDTHYRVVFAAEDGTKAYAIVPGRTVNGPATGESVPVSGTMTFDDRTQNVSTTVPVENGTYSVRLSTPGTYTIGNRTVTVTGTQTINGS